MSALVSFWLSTAVIKQKSSAVQCEQVLKLNMAGGHKEMLFLSLPDFSLSRNILLNYAACYPELGYTQGMSDLLAPVLAEMQDEAEAFWCFVGLMQRTIFVSSPKDGDMDVNLVTRFPSNSLQSGHLDQH